MPEAVGDGTGSEMALHPMTVMYPGARVPAADVDTHCVPGPTGVLQVHLTRYPLEPPSEYWSRPESLVMHRMAVDPRPIDETESFIPTSSTEEERSLVLLEQYRQEDQASVACVVVARADGAPPLLVLDGLRQRRSATVVGVIVDDHTVLAWVHTHDGYGGTSGYLVTMTADDPGAPGPVSLYPSALWGWAQWWCDQAQQLVDNRDVGLADLPPPPLALDVVEAWRAYRVLLTGPDRVGFPAPNPLRRIGPPDIEPTE
ncbi:hypothetical protein AB0K89_26390 [Streptomyces cinnamoneus]|uniref:hypothetical protein n=1 Tax=Streptomyces cinnamoneus TaxID=53446 RepID=UPI003437C83A